MFSTTTLVKIAVLLDEDEEKQIEKGQKRKRRFWVHDMLKRRNQEGEFSTLHPELIDDETKFFKYYRMSINEFNNLLKHRSFAETKYHFS